LSSFIWTVLAFAAVLAPLIVLHEFGHFVVAKLFGIRVDVFSIGFGKRLFGLKRGDTDYRVSMLPLGGYVKMAGENLDEQVTGAPHEFMSKPKWQRFCVALAGPVMNILVALMISAVVVMIHNEVPAYQSKPAVVQGVEPESPADKAGIKAGDTIVNFDGKENPVWLDVDLGVLVNPGRDIPVIVKRGEATREFRIHLDARGEGQEQVGYSGLRPEDWRVTVREVSPDTPAAAAGLQPGDNIVAVNGNRVEQSQYGVGQVLSAIQGNGGASITLTVNRNGQKLDLTGTPQMKDGAYRLGFGQELEGFEMAVAPLPPGEAIRHSIDENIRIIVLTKTLLGQVFTGQRSVRDSVSGPIGMAQMSKQMTQHGVWTSLKWASFVSLNLGVFNLLPIPVLDGGLIFMLLLESLLGFFGLPLTLRIKEKMMQVGFVMLVLLMGFVIFNDISKSVSTGRAPQQQAEQPQKPPETK
jgi:regulator of sigma E protease